MLLDGVNDYIENTSGFITAYPFSVSVWIKAGKITGTQGIVMFGNSATTTTYYGIQLVNAKPSIVVRNTRARTATSTTALTAGKRYHLVGVFNSTTDRRLYLDGVQTASNTNNVSFSATNPQWRIGRYVGSTTNYFSGNIDEVHIYNKALSTAEINELYMIPPTFDALTTYTGTPTLYGEYTPKMYDVSLVISGTTYQTTGDGTGKWKTLPMIT